MRMKEQFLDFVIAKKEHLSKDKTKKKSNFSSIQIKSPHRFYYSVVTAPKISTHTNTESVWRLLRMIEIGDSIKNHD